MDALLWSTRRLWEHLTGLATGLQITGLVPQGNPGLRTLAFTRFSSPSNSTSCPCSIPPSPKISQAESRTVWMKAHASRGPPLPPSLPRCHHRRRRRAGGRPQSRRTGGPALPSGVSSQGSARPSLPTHHQPLRAGAVCQVPPLTTAQPVAPTWGPPRRSPVSGGQGSGARGAPPPPRRPPRSRAESGTGAPCTAAGSLPSGLSPSDAGSRLWEGRPPSSPGLPGPAGLSNCLSGW